MPQASSHRLAPTGGGGFGKFLLTLLFAGGFFAFLMYYLKESPQQMGNQLVDYANKLLYPPAPAPAPHPAPVAPVTVAPPPPPAPVAPPPPAPVVTPPPKADPLAWVMETKEHWSHKVTLNTDTVFPILLDGKQAGTGNIPAGSILDVVQINPPNVILACSSYGGGQQSVPISSTDLMTVAAAAQKKAEADALAAALAPPPAPTNAAPATNTVVIPAAPSSEPTTNIATAAASPDHQDSNKAFVHPGLLHTEADFQRMREKVNAHAEPWRSGWERLIANRHASSDWNPQPSDIVYRGFDRVHHENYAHLFNDAAAAYALALRWKISGDPVYAKQGIKILNAWGTTLTSIQGTSDRCLAAGIYGYELANAAEILRTSPDWSPDDFAQFKKMMLDVFVPMNHGFLVGHNGAGIAHYWANWDLCNMASLLSIGVLTDRRDLYDEAVDYFKHGAGNGSISHAAPFLYPDQNLAQWQESGRDQGHSLMGIGIMGAFCQMAWNQGDDLYGYDDNRFLKAAEYVAQYNLGEDVPYTPYDNESVPHPYSLATISDKARGNDRPVWELVYNHYVREKGLAAPHVAKMAAKVRPEGGGGDYGPNSGGFDQLGYGTLTFTRSMGDGPGDASASQ